jgi:hypothetical protein
MENEESRMKNEECPSTTSASSVTAKGSAMKNGIKKSLQ